MVSPLGSSVISFRYGYSVGNAGEEEKEQRVTWLFAPLGSSVISEEKGVR